MLQFEVFIGVISGPLFEISSRLSILVVLLLVDGGFGAVKSLNRSWLSLNKLFDLSFSGFFAGWFGVEPKSKSTSWDWGWGT